MAVFIDPLALQKGFPKDGGSSEKIKWFVDNYGSLIKDAVKGTGICFPLIVAQACEESFYGADPKAQVLHNFGGVRNRPIGSVGKTKSNYAIFPDAKTYFESLTKGVYLDTKKKYNTDNQLVKAKTPLEQLKFVAYGGYCEGDPEIYISRVKFFVEKVSKMYPFSKIA